MSHIRRATRWRANPEEPMPPRKIQVEKPIKKPATVPTFRELVDLWPSIRVFGEDIGVTIHAARKMHQRDAIAEEHWAGIEDVARRRRLKTAAGESVTVRLLAAIASDKRRRCRSVPTARLNRVA